jgi:hypothetical protein
VKNIQVIDGADNCEYCIFAAMNKEFEAIFPDGQDIEFIEDFINRVGDSVAGKITEAMWKRPVNKKPHKAYTARSSISLSRKGGITPPRRNQKWFPLVLTENS